MWCEKTKNGKYKFCERYKNPLTGKLEKISVTMDKNTSASKKLAEKEIQRRIDDKISATSVDIAKLTFGELVEKYLDHQKRNVKYSTFVREKGCSNSLLDMLGKDILINNLSARYIRECLIKTGKENGTLNEYLKRLKALLKWGYRNDYLENISYLEKLERFNDISKKEKIQDKFLETDEIKKLIKSMENSNQWLWVYFTKFLILSGLRFGEAAALLDTDIDETNIHINKTYDIHSDTVTSPKTSESIRDVFIQDELAVLIRQIRLFFKLNKVKSILFFSYNGEYLHYDAYRIFLARHSQKSIGRKITPHALRHTHASLLMEKGVDIEAISRRLGHSNSKITREIYLHVTQNLKEKDNMQIKKLKIM